MTSLTQELAAFARQVVANDIPAKDAAFMDDVLLIIRSAPFEVRFVFVRGGGVCSGHLCV